MRPGDARGEGLVLVVNYEGGGGQGEKGVGGWWVRLTRNQGRATDPLCHALVHEDIEPGVEVEPAGFAARVDSSLIPVAQQRESEIICRMNERRVRQHVGSNRPQKK